MGETAVKFALDKLNDLLKMGLELNNVREEITHVQAELSIIEGFLQDADSKRNTNPAVQRWVNQVREVAYRIQAAIDTFLEDIEGNSRRRIDLFSKLVSYAKKPFKLNKLGEEVKAIRETLRTIGRIVAELGITNNAAANDENDEPPFRPTIPEEIDGSDVVGLESDEDKIIKHLLDRSVSRRTVLSIVGIGGIGKTTLAKKVYESTRLEGQFDCRIWLSISQKFNVHDLLRKILKELQNEELAIEDDKLWSAVQKFLNKKRYFIILDDVWSTDLWKRLKIAIPDKKNASRVLITSRSEDVSRAADRDTELCKLRFLNETDSLDLLFRKAFPNREPGGSYPELNKVAKELSKKCDGLPLALTVLGGILSTREESYTAWQEVNSTLNWHTEKTELCQQVLHLSYEDLPQYLKQCFLYFASFPEDHKISAKHVIKMWIAEESRAKDGQAIKEDTAKEYFRELVQRWIQVLKNN
ncbi:hypothetical protein LUZ61_000129 [Rhynchospora tenuis]|uniref:Uncharacterized protein n=1 Tax=Rhynchospora tenuis TaxID=198213 RepID=A0AAD5ZEF3_9POAL|nr:hypothetical protein LUZ61_000129 [Rhynchospora tenuis]